MTHDTTPPKRIWADAALDKLIREAEARVRDHAAQIGGDAAVEVLLRQRAGCRPAENPDDPAGHRERDPPRRQGRIQMTDLTREQIEALLDGVTQNPPRVCVAWCGKAKDDCDCYKAGVAVNSLNDAAPDLARALIASDAARKLAEERLVKATKLLDEARGDLSTYVGMEYPAESRAKYPSVERRWQRDMALCREIDAFLKEIDNG